VTGFAQSLESVTIASRAMFWMMWAIGSAIERSCQVPQDNTTDPRNQMQLDRAT
jgi:hypothetical protein